MEARSRASESESERAERARGDTAAAGALAQVPAPPRPARRGKGPAHAARTVTLAGAPEGAAQAALARLQGGELASPAGSIPEPTPGAPAGLSPITAHIDGRAGTPPGAPGGHLPGPATAPPPEVEAATVDGEGGADMAATPGPSHATPLPTTPMTTPTQPRARRMGTCRLWRWLRHRVTVVRLWTREGTPLRPQHPDCPRSASSYLPLKSPLPYCRGRPREAQHPQRLPTNVGTSTRSSGARVTPPQSTRPD